MATPTLIFYYTNTPFYLNTYNLFQIGYINSNGKLTNVTNSIELNIIVQESNAIINYNAYNPINNGFDYASIRLNSSNQTESVFLKISYLDTIIYQSLALVQDWYNQNLSNLLLIYQQQLPTFYTTKADSNQVDESKSLMSIFEAIYDNSNIPDVVFPSINTVRQNIYPVSGADGWEQFLTGSNNLLYQQSTDYPNLLKLLYQLAINNNPNAFYLAQNISAYIWYRLGVQYYIFIDQYTINYQNGFIVGNNSLGQVILSNLNNSVNAKNFTIYVLYGTDTSLLPQFNTSFQAELNNFIYNNVPPYLNVTINYDTTLDDLIENNGFVYIADTYAGDPNQDGNMCIAFNEESLANALGYSGDVYGAANVVSFTLSITPSPLSYAVDDSTQTITLISNTTYTAQLVPVYSTTPSSSVTDNINNFAQFYSDDLDMVKCIYENSTTEQIVVGNPGTYTGRIYLGKIYYNIIWIIE